jgi:hypothetical protein
MASACGVGVVEKFLRVEGRRWRIGDGSAEDDRRDRWS